MSKVSSFVCTRCHRIFTTKQAISDHMKSGFHTPKFACKTCNTALPDQHHLEKHYMFTGHNAQQASKFHCGDCNHSFARQSALDTHLGSFVHARTVQPTVLEFGCERCGVSFLSQNLRDQHSVATGHFPPQPRLPPAFPCGKCARNFVNRVALNNHLGSSIHAPKSVPVVPNPTPTIPAPCNPAPRSPHTATNTSTPTPPAPCNPAPRSHHTATNASTPTPPAPCNPAPRPPPTTPNFPCSNCNKHHPTKHARDTHICARTSFCNECKKDFVNLYALHQHLVSSVHLMVPKPAFKFYCDECDMGFLGCEQMKRHIASSIHAGGFECEECRRMFNTGDLLALHVVVHVKGRKECL